MRVTRTVVDAFLVDSGWGAADGVPKRRPGAGKHSLEFSRG